MDLSNINLTNISEILTRVKTLNMRNCEKMIQPQCYSIGCTKMSRCMRGYTITPGKKAVYKLERNTKINLERQQSSRLEYSFCFIENNTIGFFCEYHENNLSFDKRKKFYDIIINSKIILPKSTEFLQSINYNNLYFDYKKCDVYYKYNIIKKECDFYKENLPNRFNINYNWKLDKDYDTLKSHQNFIIEHIENDTDNEIYSNLFELIKVIIADNIKIKGKFDGFSRRLTEKIMFMMDVLIDELIDNNYKDIEQIIIKFLNMYDIFDYIKLFY